jgi:hypothetical protein
VAANRLGARLKLALTAICCRFSDLIGPSDFSKQNQDQDDNKDQAESAPSIVSRSIKGPAANPAEATQKSDNQDDKQDGSKGHAVSPVGAEFVLDAFVRHMTKVGAVQIGHHNAVGAVVANVSRVNPDDLVAVQFDQKR